VSEPNWPLRVTDALAPVQREAILHRFLGLNPRWRGVTPADVLDTLNDGDSDLGVLEPFFEAHPELVKPGAGIAARAILWSGQELMPATLSELLSKAAPRQPESQPC
jgi:hypothetical protein